jgi:isopentenyl diphosphate isomerase/L-lactate dehydrogenase-like FMN-dependent dehydrogenase
MADLYLRLRGAYNIDDLREMSRRRLPKGLFEFVDRGAEDELTVARNRAAFDKRELVPRVLVDVSARSQKIDLFGAEQASPIIVGPTGATSLLWYDGELALARAAAKAGIPYTLSISSITPMEKVAEEGGGQQWFQLYMWPDRNMSFEIVDRAKNLGFKVLIVTVDNVAAPNREYNQRNQMSVPMQFSARNIWHAAWHPHWATTVMGRYLLTTGIPTFSNLPKQLQSNLRGKGILFPRPGSLTWDDIRAIRSRWSAPLLVKGIMHPADALSAVNCGADGVVISNHGGRSLDSAPATLDVLPRIVDAIGDKATVLLDGGIRRGTDVAKALALGAQAVLMGRAPLWGIASAGEAGASHALAILISEIDRVMALTGCTSVAQFRVRNEAPSDST